VLKDNIASGLNWTANLVRLMPYIYVVKVSTICHSVKLVSCDVLQETSTSVLQTNKITHRCVTWAEGFPTRWNKAYLAAICNIILRDFLLLFLLLLLNYIFAQSLLLSLGTVPV
jgi:hypothetical protein